VTVSKLDGISVPVVDRLYEISLRQRLYHGYSATAKLPLVQARDFEADGRKANVTARKLLAAKLIDRAPLPDIDAFTVCVGSVLSTLTAVEPSMTVLDDTLRRLMIEGTRPIGKRYDSFAYAEKLWALHHRDEYRWFWVARGGLETDWEPGAPTPDAHWNQELFIASRAMRDEYKRASRDHRIASLMKQNFGWALHEFAKLDEATIKMFTGIGADTFGYDDTFSGDPSTWEAQAESFLKRANARLATAQQQVAAAQQTLDAVQNLGGWDVLATKLRAGVDDLIDKKGDADA
jgi:hypothetical protein